MCQIFALHIDSGFMRKNESSGVAEALTSIGLNLKASSNSRAARLRWYSCMAARVCRL